VPSPTSTATVSPPITKGTAVVAVPPTRVWPTPTVEEFADEVEPLSLATRVAPWVLGLQVVALILGVYVALRRPSR
jgi:hypothetical protein